MQPVPFNPHLGQCIPFVPCSLTSSASVTAMMRASVLVSDLARSTPPLYLVFVLLGYYTGRSAYWVILPLGRIHETLVILFLGRPHEAIEYPTARLT